MSLMNSSKNHIKLFVYGTLKRNETYNHELSDRDATFICDAVTVDKWPLIVATDLNLPFLLNKKNAGKVRTNI